MDIKKEIPESKVREILIEAGKSAAAGAIGISNDLSLSIHDIRDGKLIESVLMGLSRS